jgi:hypothetical protein
MDDFKYSPGFSNVLNMAEHKESIDGENVNIGLTSGTLIGNKKYQI